MARPLHVGHKPLGILLYSQESCVPLRVQLFSGAEHLLFYNMGFITMLPIA